MADKRKGRQFCLAANCLPNRQKLLARALGNLFATVVAGGAYVVTQVHFTGCLLNRQRRIAQEIVSTMHAALGRGFFVLLNGHK
jgi:hypothetical protein